MSLINSNSFLYKTVDGVKQFFSPLVNASTVVLQDGSKLEEDGKIHVDQAVNAEMLGGKEPKYYIQPRNLLDNSDFRNPVNQRGQTTVENNFIVDRWYTFNDNQSGGATLTSSGIILSGNGYLQQRLSKGILQTGKPYTFAVYYSDGTVDVGTNGVIIFGDGDFDLVNNVYANGKTISHVALYEGEYTAETLPPYVPKGYAVEFAECQRYFERFVANTAWHIFAFGAVTKNGNKATFQFNYAKKRIQSPTLNMSGNFCVIHDGTTITPTSWTWSNANDNSMLIDAVITGVTLGKAVYIQAHNDTSAYIDISADL